MITPDTEEHDQPIVQNQSIVVPDSNNEVLLECQDLHSAPIVCISCGHQHEAVLLPASYDLAQQGQIFLAISIEVSFKAKPGLRDPGKRPRLVDFSSLCLR